MFEAMLKIKMIRLSIWNASTLFKIILLMGLVQTQNHVREYNMDELSTCGQKIMVYDYEVVLNGRSRTAPVNPNRECVVVFESGYTDSKNKLQIVKESLDINDCTISVTLYEGEYAYGTTLRHMGCRSASTDTLYSRGRSVTFQLKRPSNVDEKGYDFRFRIKAWKDPDERGVTSSGLKLSPGAIIGITMALLALVVFALLLVWCFVSGRFPGLEHKKYKSESRKSSFSVSKEGSIHGSENPVLFASIAKRRKAESIESGLDDGKSSFDHRDPLVFSALTGIDASKSQKSNGSRQMTSNLERYNVPPAPPIMDFEPPGGRRYAKRGERNSFRNNDAISNDHQRGDEKLARNGANRDNSKPSVLMGPDGYAQIMPTEDEILTRRASLRATKNKNGNNESPSQKRRASGLFDNPDEEGYLYDYDQVKALSDDSSNHSPRSNDKVVGVDAPVYSRTNKGKPELPPRNGSGDNFDKESKLRRSLDRQNGTLPPDCERQGKTMSVPEAKMVFKNGSPSDKYSANIENGPTDRFVPEMLPTDSDTDEPKYSSIDQSSEPNLSDVMTNPFRGDGPLRASVSDDIEPKGESPSQRRKRPKGSGASPKQKRHHSPKQKRDRSPTKHESSQDYLPPEASTPIFSTDASSDHYSVSDPIHPYENQGYGPPATAGYGFVPMQMFGGLMQQPYAYNPQPGTQTVMYAYQTEAPPGQGAQPHAPATGQAGFFVQSSTPDRQGSVKKSAFMMSTTHGDPNRRSKRKDGTPKSKRKNTEPFFPETPGPPGYSSTPHNENYPGAYNQDPRYSNSPYSQSPYGNTPDQTALIPANMAPPVVHGYSPQSPHRSAVMKTSVDPNSGVQTTQVTWKDNIPDPTDPKDSDSNPSITRKTVTRVTTKGGHGDLPANDNIFHYLDTGTSDPPFLSPSSSQLAIQESTPSRNPAYISKHSKENQNFYSGVPQSAVHPGSSAPVVHSAPVRNRAIKDSVSIA